MSFQRSTYRANEQEPDEVPTAKRPKFEEPSDFDSALSTLSYFFLHAHMCELPSTI